MARALDLSDALEQLYAVPPGEFVAARRSLVARLRDAGETDAARQLAGMRRPTTAAWSLNQLARERADLVEDLLRRTRELEQVQSGVSPGRADALRAASAARREALRSSVDAAVVIAARLSGNSESHRTAIASTLEAAGLDDDVSEGLRAGCLVREASSPAGFPEIASLTAIEGGARATPPATPETDRRAAVEAALEEAEAKARRLEQEASAHALVAAEAEDRVEEARSEVEQAKARLDSARAAARRTRTELRESQRKAAAATHAAEAARRRHASE